MSGQFRNPYFFKAQLWCQNLYLKPDIEQGNMGKLLLIKQEVE